LAGFYYPYIGNFLELIGSYFSLMQWTFCSPRVWHEERTMEMEKDRNPRYAPEFLEQQPSPSGISAAAGSIPDVGRFANLDPATIRALPPPRQDAKVSFAKYWNELPPEMRARVAQATRACRGGV
jgi:hypothetical protein